MAPATAAALPLKPPTVFCQQFSLDSEARRLLESRAVYINGQQVDRQQFDPSDFPKNVALLRRGKAYKDSALVKK